MKSTIYLLLFSILLSCNEQDIFEQNEEIIEHAELDSNVNPTIPHLFIATDDELPITSKEDYLRGEITIDGKGIYDDLSAQATRVRGRGNTTWQKPKKPYRIKLDNATAILGLAKAKDWVLLANHQDYTFMTNAVALKIGSQLGLPYTNSLIAVDVTINGVYQGIYNLTEQIEVKQERINVGDDGVLLELDDYFDEDYKFKSKLYKLPVNIKAPDIESDEQFEAIKEDFEELERLIYDDKFPENNYGNYFNKQQFVNYLIVNNLVNNTEINYPKSVYLHKTKSGKYTMGPIWDFDWGFGFHKNTQTYFNSPTASLLSFDDKRPGALFFKRLMTDPEIKDLYRQTWTNYRDNHFVALLEYIEQFASSIRDSHPNDFAKWKVGSNNLPGHKKDMKIYLRSRANYIDHYVDNL
jgi:hypothetical protein